MSISLLNRDSRRSIVWVTSALITITSASAELDCSKLKPTTIQEGEWSSPSNTLRSERFDIFWGDKRSSEPWKDVPTNSPSYFDPREPATIEAITAKLRTEWANVSKRNVTSVLRSLVTYQRNFRRRRPPDIKNRMFLYNPGMIAMDMFFPSANDGWERYSCLTCMDTWSRYVGIYAIATKKYDDVLWAMRDFLAKFASMGHLPRRILSDQGTDMACGKGGDRTVPGSQRRGEADGDALGCGNARPHRGRDERTSPEKDADLPDLRAYRFARTDLARDYDPNQQ